MAFFWTAFSLDPALLLFSSQIRPCCANVAAFHYEKMPYVQSNQNEHLQHFVSHRSPLHRPPFISPNIKINHTCFTPCPTSLSPLYANLDIDCIHFILILILIFMPIFLRNSLVFPTFPKSENRSVKLAVLKLQMQILNAQNSHDKPIHHIDYQSLWYTYSATYREKIIEFKIFLHFCTLLPHLKNTC